MQGNIHADYMRICELRDDITLANIALVLIHQTDFLLRRLLEKYKQEFLENGGIKEQMSQARRSWREALKLLTPYINSDLRLKRRNDKGGNSTRECHSRLQTPGS